MLGSLLSEAALIVPCKGILKACAMFLPVSSDSPLKTESDFGTCF